MPRDGFEPGPQAFKRTKTVHALDRVAIVIGLAELQGVQNKPRTLDGLKWNITDEIAAKTPAMLAATFANVECNVGFLCLQVERNQFEHLL
jgi:hypothetical protein